MMKLLLAAALAAIPYASPAQTMYKCVVKGKTQYQADPCPESATQGTLKAPPAAPATPAPQTTTSPSAPASNASGSPKAPSDTEIDSTIDFMSTYRACADGVKTWGQEMAPLYAQWRSKHSAVVSRIERDPALQARYESQVKTKQNPPAMLCRPVGQKLRGLV